MCQQCTCMKREHAICFQRILKLEYTLRKFFSVLSNTANFYCKLNSNEQFQQTANEIEAIATSSRFIYFLTKLRSKAITLTQQMIQQIKNQVLINTNFILAYLRFVGQGTQTLYNYWTQLTNKYQLRWACNQMNQEIARLRQQIDKCFLDQFARRSGISFFKAMAAIKHKLSQRMLKKLPDSEAQCKLKELSGLIVAIKREQGKQKDLPAVPLDQRRKPSQINEFISELMFPKLSLRNQINQIRVHFRTELRDGRISTQQSLQGLQSFMELYWELYGRQRFSLFLGDQLNVLQIKKCLTSIKRTLAIKKQKAFRQFSYKLSSQIRKKIIKGLRLVNPQNITTDQIQGFLKTKWIGPKGWQTLKLLPFTQKQFKDFFDYMDRTIVPTKEFRRLSTAQRKLLISYKKIKSQYLKQKDQQFYQQHRLQRESFRLAEGQGPNIHNQQAKIQQFSAWSDPPIFVYQPSILSYQEQYMLFPFVFIPPSEI